MNDPTRTWNAQTLERCGSLEVLFRSDPTPFGNTRSSCRIHIGLRPLLAGGSPADGPRSHPPGTATTSRAPRPTPRTTTSHNTHITTRLRDLDTHGHGADRCTPRSKSTSHPTRRRSSRNRSATARPTEAAVTQRGGPRRYVRCRAWTVVAGSWMGSGLGWGGFEGHDGAMTMFASGSPAV